MNDPYNNHDHERELKAAARKSFPEFYAKASPEDEHLIDGLVLGHGAMAVLLNVERGGVVEPIRNHLERCGDAVDQMFAMLRENVRRCRTFQAVSEGERVALERQLLTVRPPIDSQ